MKKTKLFVIILIVFLITLFGAAFWFENQEANLETNEYIPLPDSLIQKIKSQDSTEKADFLNVTPPNMQAIKNQEIVFEQKKDNYTFQILSDTLGVKILVFWGTKKVGELIDKSKKNIVKVETSDLNSNSYPEVLIYTKTTNKIEFTGYEAKNGLIKFVLPPLMGRQSFGYAGQDTLFMENNNLVRRFQFKNAQFSTFPSGIRSCEYTLGHDLKFTMIRTLDTE